MFRDLWAYRQFIASSIQNEMINRFARSKLRSFWVILNPLSQALIYALILSNVLAIKLPEIENKYAYAIYLMSGLLAWSLFTNIVSRCLNIFIDNASLIKRIRFPMVALPAIVAGSNTINNGFLLLSILGIFLLLGHSFSLMIFWLLPLTLILVGFSIGLGLILGVFNVFFRDLSQIVPIVLQVWFWFTPIVYPESIIPTPYRDWFTFNPIYSVVSSYHNILLYRTPPEFSGILIFSLLAFALLTLSLILFRRSDEDLVDAL